MKKVQLFLALMLLFSAVSAKKKDGWISLFNGKNLTGWHQLNGQAKYHIENGEIVGSSVSKTPNSFLATDKDYSNFIIELDLLVDNDMNSGCLEFGMAKEAPIMLQYRHDQVKFRSLKITKL